MRTAHLIYLTALSCLLAFADGAQGGPTSENERYRELLTRHLARNKETWSALIKNGFNPDSRVQLDFFYYGTSKERVEALQTPLHKETDYESEIRETEEWWVLSGKTQPIVISPEVLDQWVDWMLTAGLQFHCEFDGWGTEIP